MAKADAPREKILEQLVLRVLGAGDVEFEPRRRWWVGNGGRVVTAARDAHVLRHASCGDGRRCIERWACWFSSESTVQARLVRTTIRQ